MLPAVQGDLGLLPALDAPHLASLEDVFDLFVSAAPYSKERQELWAVFPIYVRKVRALFPTCRILLDGGFTTHKPWAAPEDIDVSVGVEKVHYEMLQPWERAELFNTEADGVKVRAMGGLVDASRFQLGNPDRFVMWHEHWSTVRGQDRNIIEGLRKGYVEVVS